MNEGAFSEEERNALDLDLTRLHTEATALVAKAEAMEKEGRLEEAKALYESVGAFAADFPGIQEQIKQTEEALALVTAIKRRSNRSRQAAAEVPKSRSRSSLHTLLANSKTHPLTKAIGRGIQRIYQAATEVAKKPWREYLKTLLANSKAHPLTQTISRGSQRIYQAATEAAKKPWRNYLKTLLANSKAHPLAQTISRGSQRIYQAATEVSKKLWPNQAKPLLGIAVLGGIAAVSLALFFAVHNNPQKTPSDQSPQKNMGQATASLQPVPAPVQVSSSVSPQFEETPIEVQVPAAPQQAQPVIPAASGKAEPPAPLDEPIQATQPENTTHAASEQMPPPEQAQPAPTAAETLVPAAPLQTQPAAPVTTDRTITSELQAAHTQAGQPEVPASKAITHGLPDLPLEATPAANIEHTYIVQPGDSLSRIAESRFCNMEAWKTIYKNNQERISNPNELHPGMVLYLQGIENRCQPGH